MKLRQKIFLALALLLPLRCLAADDIATLADTAHRLFWSQDYEGAAQAFARVLALNERLEAQGSDEALVPVELFHVYNEYAECHKVFGDYRKAKELYGRLGDVAAEINDTSLTDVYRLGVADCHLYTGEYALARDAVAGVQGSEHGARKAIYIASINFREGNLAEAKRGLDELLQRLPPQAEDYPTALQNRGYISWQIDPRGDEAYRDLSAALGCLNPGDDSYYWTLSNLALLQARRGERAAALANIERCIAHFKAKSRTRVLNDYIISLRKKAEILQMVGDVKAAAGAFREFYEAERRFVEENFAVMTEQQRLDFWKKEKPLVSEIFALEDADAGFLYDVALFRRQTALLGSADSAAVRRKLAVTRAAVARSLGKNDVAVEFVKYEARDSMRYAALVLGAGGTARFVPLWTEEALKAFPVGGQSLDDALCSTLGADKNAVYTSEALSSFVWGRLLPLIPRGSTVYFAPDGVLHLLAIEYLPAVRGGYELHRLTSTALLTQRGRKRATAGGKTLVLGGMDYDDIPPGGDTAGGEHNRDAYNYLAENDFARHFTYLPGTKVEAAGVAAYLTDKDIHDVFDEGQMKSGMGGYARVHLATHGYSWQVEVPTVPYAYRDSITEDKSLLASGIALSGANRLHRQPGREDGLLSARELCELHLSGVSLVVASCCQSAQGRVSDEGPAGLVRGLKKAGVETIIASLWPVNDRATMLLMQFFYDEWREGKGREGKGCSVTRALALAQARLREHENDVRTVRVYNPARKKSEYRQVATTFDAPHYWAPFIVIDDI